MGLLTQFKKCIIAVHWVRTDQKITKVPNPYKKKKMKKTTPRLVVKRNYRLVWRRRGRGVCRKVVYFEFCRRIYSFAEGALDTRVTYADDEASACGDREVEIEKSNKLWCARHFVLWCSYVMPNVCFSHTGMVNGRRELTTRDL